MSIGNLHMVISNFTPVIQYELLSSAASVNEGTQFDITLNVVSKPSWINLDGFTFDYTIDGSGIDSNDISGASTAGTFVLQNDQAAITFNTSINDDTLLFVTGQRAGTSQYAIGKYRINKDLTINFFDDLGGPGGSGQVVQSLFFRPDGTQSFHIDTSSNTLHRSINTSGEAVPSVDQWLVPNSSGVSVDLYFQAGNVGDERRGIWISQDGTQYFTISRSEKTIYHRQASTPWTFLTTSAVGTLSIFSEATNPNGIFVKEDLSRGYVVDAQQRIYEYVGDASAAGGVSNWSLNHAIALSDLGALPGPTDITIDSTGQFLYIASFGGGIWVFEMSTPWDLSTLTYTRLLDLSNEFSSVTGVHVATPPSETFRINVPVLDLSEQVLINNAF